MSKVRVRLAMSPVPTPGVDSRSVRAGDMVGSTGKLASSSDLDRSLTFSDVAGVDEAKSQVQVGGLDALLLSS